LSYRPLGLSVLLCRNTEASCIDVTNVGSGTTSAWSGQTSNVPFLFRFRVAGTGTMNAAYGQTDQAIVNYQ
jgi:hypothetical protein